MNSVIWLTVILVLLLDQLSKALILRTLVQGKSLEVIENIFYLTLVHNTGAAFGIFRHQTAFFIIVSILAILVITVYIKRRQDTLIFRDIALALILGGAIGNLVDRLRFGYVVDFFDFRVWPVFNVADSCITVGTFLLIVSLLKRKV